MESIHLIDNFLDPAYLRELQQLFLYESELPWYYNDSVVYDDDKTEHYQFTHLFYNDLVPKSQYYNTLIPCIEHLDVLSLIRIKSNLLTRTSSHIEHGFHVDITNMEYNSKTAILYLNTNNGYTLFRDGTKIDSIENRMVIFNSNLEHTGSTCTDEKVRVVINFNYF
jgi:hypothetical protein